MSTMLNDPRTDRDPSSEKPRTERPASESRPASEANFVETALVLGGKSAEEVRTTTAVDRADEQVEQMFEAKYQTAGSPAHRAVWDDDFPVDLFVGRDTVAPADVQETMRRSLDVVRTRRDAGTLLDARTKISDESLADLAQAGYWGLLVDREYGGAGCGFVPFAKFLTRMATVDPTVAGLASVHGCIGAVDPLRTFGTPEQKRRHLPLLASGERLSAFALTEPCAGSDLTALRTTAVRDGDRFLVTGEKLFITNAAPGRTVGLVCLVDGTPSVLVADLPEREDETFRIVPYGLHALRHAHNVGLKFNDFPVPAENLLRPVRGDGLTIAYHGLNRGRVALCANAAGTMRVMLASILPWARYRRTYGAAIETRELVRRRVGRLAGLIVGCDALVEWCATLLDDGYRGEMECIVAKIFGSEAQKEAAIELFMKTHGGRAFLHGHLFGDYVHEFLAPCIYEGEGEMLGMAFFKSLVKEHGKACFEPIGRALAESGIRQPNPLNPAHAWALRKALVPYAKWRLGEVFKGSPRVRWPHLTPELRAHAEFAAKGLRRSRLEIDTLMRKHQLKLADRQCAMTAASARVQNLLVMLATSLYAGRREDPVVRGAADVLCRELARQTTGRRLSDGDFRAQTKLGAAIAEHGTTLLDGVEAPEILRRYDA